MEYIPDGLTKEQWAAIKKKVGFIHFETLTKIEHSSYSSFSIGS
jgi:hypothetical protein